MFKLKSIVTAIVLIEFLCVPVVLFYNQIFIDFRVINF